MKFQHTFVGTADIPGFESQPRYCSMISALQVLLPITELYKQNSSVIQKLDSEQLILFHATHIDQIVDFANLYNYLNKDFIVADALSPQFDLETFEALATEKFLRLDRKLRTRRRFNNAIFQFQKSCRAIESNTDSRTNLLQIFNDIGIMSWLPDLPSKNQFYIDQSFPRQMTNYNLCSVLNQCAANHGDFSVDKNAASVHIYWTTNAQMKQILEYKIKPLLSEIYVILVVETRVENNRPIFDAAAFARVHPVYYNNSNTLDPTINAQYNGQYIINSILDALDYLRDQPLYDLDDSMSTRDISEIKLKQSFEQVRKLFHSVS